MKLQAAILTQHEDQKESLSQKMCNQDKLLYYRLQRGVCRIISWPGAMTLNL